MKPTGSFAPSLNRDAELASSAETRSLFGRSYDNVAAFAELLRAEGEPRGLIGPSEASRIWDRHILNSAALLGFLPKQGMIADLGSGAGLPGVVLAMARPELRFTLVEPMERRASWLSDVIARFELDNAEVLNCRGEEVRERSFSAVTSRAVAAVGKLANISVPLLDPGGSLLALKGRGVSEELGKADKVLRRLKVAAPELTVVRAVPNATETTVLQIRKLR